MANFEVKVRGLAELQRKLVSLGEGLAKKHLKRALKAGGQVFEKGMKRRAPRAPEPGSHPEYGHLQDQIQLKTSVTKKGGRASVSTGDAFWGRFQEFGHGPGKKTPFARPTFDGDSGEALQTFADTLAEGLKQEAK